MTGRVVHHLPGAVGVRAVAFAPTGRTLATASGAGTTQFTLWDLDREQPVVRFTGHVGMVTRMSFSPDGRRLASGVFDRTVKVWDTADGRELLTLGGQGEAPRGAFLSPEVVWDVAFGPSGHQIVSVSGLRVRVWDGTPDPGPVRAGPLPAPR
jgi:WD40 repeat protein